jgi:hypothetical protein
MDRLLQAYRRIFPRRRRLWRYVSPSRRGISLAILALLVVAAYGYGRMTQDDRVRRLARSYLRDLTGGRVQIGRAHFDLFSGVRLSDVRVYTPGELSAEPFLRAKTVILRYKPAAMLFGGAIQPAEVICVEPVVTLEYDVQKDRYNFQRFFPAGAALAAQTGANAALPPIRVRQGRLRWVDVDHGLRVPFEEMPITLSMTPGQPGEYLITFEEQHEGGAPAIAGSLSLDVRTGQARPRSGTVPIPHLDKALPGKYRQWRQRYGIQGEVRLAVAAEPSSQGVASTKASIAPQPSTSAEPMACQLVDVSMTLPPEEGGMELAHVAGTVLLDEAGVTLRDIRGQLPGAGGSEFVLSGRYEGYEANSPFRLTVSAASISLPDSQQAGGKLAELFHTLRRDYKLIGHCTLNAELWRDPEGEVDYRAIVEPQGMSATYRGVPYRLDDIHGTVVVTPGGAELRGVWGRRNDARFDIGGVVVPADVPGATVLTVAGKDVLLDRELHDALPATVKSAWDAVNPSGRLSVNTEIACDGDGNVAHVKAAIEMTGRASIRLRDFPYRVDNLVGKATVSDRDVVVEDVRGSRGVMSCLGSGTIIGAGLEDGTVDLTIEARQLTVDEELVAALPDSVRRMVASFHPAGTIEQMHCRLSQPAGGTMQCEGQATVAGLSFQPEKVPCKVTDARGEVQIAPGQVTVKDLIGTCGQGQVVVNGRMLLGEKDVGLDVTAKATGVPMDEKLLAALPTDVADLGKKLSVSGLADIDLVARSEPGQAPDYQLRLYPQAMDVRCEGFPVALGGVRGTVLATPGRIEMDNLTAEQGSMRMRISGTIASDANTVKGDVSLNATDLPITRELIAAMPAEVNVLMGRLAGGGSCDANVQKLSWVSPKPAPAASAPAASAPAASAPASQPARRTTWELDGGIALKDAAVNLDFGRRTIWGALDGKMASVDGNLAIEVNISLSEVDLGQHVVNDVNGRLTKAAGASRIRIEDLSARVHGGRAAGFAEIDLTDPPRYGLRLAVEDLNLHELFRSASTQPASQPVFDMQGLLKGNIQMTATVGQLRTRQASGVLKISQGRIRQLPVVVGFIHVIYLWLPGQNTFTDGDVSYRLQGDNLIFEEISLRGPAMSVLGSGRVNLKDESLHLTFLTGPPGRMPRLAGIDELLRGLSREVAEIRVTGTLSHPMPQTISLPGLDEAVRRLLSPERPDKE